MVATSRGWMQEGLIRGSMLSKAILPGDEELGKKDDDFHHHPHRFKPARHVASPPWSHTFRWRRRRILLVVICVAAVYLFFRRTEGDVQVGDAAPPVYGNPSKYQPPYRSGHSDARDEEPTEPPPGISRPKHGATASHTYDGQVRFFRLASTLRASASHLGGYEKRNRNVVFAMSSLASVATLVPIACDMSKWQRNHVHIVFMGREDIPLRDLLEINGIDDTSCPVIWHDARPDYTEYSSDVRAQSAVIGAMSHINSFLHPQTVLVGDLSEEEDFFAQGIRSKTRALDIALIEVPKDRSEELAWMTRLDCGSLKHWHVPTVDIVIQVPPGSSSVLRLLKSIKEADYSGITPPRIILELPASLDESVRHYVANFQWPPQNSHERAGSGLIIKRRVMNHGTTQEEATTRFLELFYPARAGGSHVLMLSPQAQLAPHFFQFTRYALLEYKYSTFGADDNERLMGISLELPNFLLDGETELVLPTLADMHTQRYRELYPQTKSVPFLWQAPNSHATLFFGDKWVELHSFLSNRVRKHQQSAKPPSRSKLVSEIYPSWMEYMVEFMRARGYSILYPAVTGDALVAIHNELYYMPEEFVSPPPGKTADASATGSYNSDAFLRAETPPRVHRRPELAVISCSMPVHLALPFGGDLPEIPHLPQLLHDGTKINPTMMTNVAVEYADDFRKTVGGCNMQVGKQRKVFKGEARDLFCFGDEDAEDWVEYELAALTDPDEGGDSSTSTAPSQVSRHASAATAATVSVSHSAAH